jgi:hypothetical protein
MSKVYVYPIFWCCGYPYAVAVGMNFLGAGTHLYVADNEISSSGTHTTSIPLMLSWAN